MSDTNLNDASFTPEINDSEEGTNKQTYSATGSFRFWCQKVLPLVYDGSLSYYELLCKVVNYLNSVIQNVDNLNTSVDNTNTAFNNLQNYVNATKDTLVGVYSELEQYVNDYFSNLDVQEEINSKLDSMAEDGSLSTIISPFIPSIVSEWLSNNITPTSPAIDASLSVSGAGADAKVTGDFIRANSAELTDIRVGADGTQYETAGKAVRTQIADAKSAIEETVNTLFEKSVFTDLFSKNIGNYTITSEGMLYRNSDYDTYVFDTSVIKSVSVSAGNSNICGYFSNKPIETSVSTDSERHVDLSGSITLPEACNYLVICVPVNSTAPTVSTGATSIEENVTRISDELSASNISQSLSNITMNTGGYINTSGNITVNEDFSYSEFIESENIVSVYACMGYNVAVLAYYNAKRQFIGYLNTTPNSYISQWWDFTAPVGTKFIRFSNRKNLPNTDVKIKKIINVETLSASIKESDNKLQYINNDIIPATVDLSVGLPGIVNISGQILDSQHHSAPILLKKGQTINFTCMSYSVIAPIARFVEDYSRYVVLVTGDENLGVHTYSYTAFEDMQIILSWYDAYTHTASINEIYSLVSLNERIAQREEVDYSACVSRILCIGDSLTAGALFLNSATNYVGDNAKSYPYFLSKEMNIQCINKGSDGATPEIWFDRLYTETVFDDYDCLLLWLGTNHGLSDTIETDVDAFSDYHEYTGNTGKYCRIIEEFKAKTNDAPVFLIKVFDGGYDTETGITREITNSVIDKIAQKYNVPTIDTTEFLYQTPPNGYSELAVKIHGVNELHFNTYGNMYIAHHFHEAMKAYWKNNTDKMDIAYRLMGNGLPWWMEH